MGLRLTYYILVLKTMYLLHSLTCKQNQNKLTDMESASLCTATVFMPSRLQVLITRQAISPLLAMRIFSNIWKYRKTISTTTLSYVEQRTYIGSSFPCSTKDSYPEGTHLSSSHKAILMSSNNTILQGK